MFKFIKYLLPLCLIGLFLSSCAPLKIPPPYIPPPSVERKTTLHTVGPGESLWRISQIYDVPIENIAHANGIDAKKTIRLGQKLIVPNAKHAEQIIPLFPSRKWQYIIIHHSATTEGNALAFNTAHLARGWDRGIGYHFVINNGRGEKEDGFVEVTPRWLKQEDGAHCKAADMNIKAIGISLVGNFDEEQVSIAQMKALIKLVNQLKDYYHIPGKNILGHGQVEGSNTHCPGKNFPWKVFYKSVK